jgi:hypothetical protein
MHVFSFDGPGQAESNLRSIRLTADNYEDAASTALDYLVQRSEVDAARIGVGSSPISTTCRPSAGRKAPGRHQPPCMA